MYNLRHDIQKNRIYIKIIKEVQNDETDNYFHEIFEIIDKCQPNFTVIADLTESNLSVLEDSAKFQPVRNYGLEKGFMNIATIISDHAYELHKSKPFVGIKNVFNSLQDAEDYLGK